jgi:hypothetical protein
MSLGTQMVWAPGRPLNDATSADLERVTATLHVGGTDVAGADGVMESDDGKAGDGRVRVLRRDGSGNVRARAGDSLPPNEPGERTGTAIERRRHPATGGLARSASRTAAVEIFVGGNSG